MTGSLDNTLKMWQLRSHELLYSVKSEEWARGAGVRRSVAFNPVFHWVASASMNSTVIVYDYQTSCVRHELKHDGGVIKLAWHPNGIVLVTGCLDGCVYLWNGRDGSLIHKMNGHTVRARGRGET